MTNNEHKLPMTPTHPRWKTFVRKLRGKQGCNFRQDSKSNIIWDCKAGADKTHAIAIMLAMGDVDVEKSIEYFNDHGGYCDCEIIFNIADA